MKSTKSDDQWEEDTVGESSIVTRFMIRRNEHESKGCLLSANSMAIMPRDQISDFRQECSSKTSGAMYDGVPQISVR